MSGARFMLALRLDYGFSQLNRRLPQKYAPDLTVDLTTGPHTILLRLDPKNLPSALRLETTEGAFSTN